MPETSRHRYHFLNVFVEKVNRLSKVGINFPFNRIQFLKINRLYNAITKKLTLQHIKN